MKYSVLQSLLVGGIALAATSASAVDIYSNDFSGASPLAGWDISQPTGSSAGISNSEGNPLPSLDVSDTSTSAFAEADYMVSGISAASSSGDTLRTSFDWNINSFACSLSNTAANPRVVLRNGDSDFVTLGFGRRGGYPQGVALFFYVTESAGTVIPTSSDTTAAAIGYNGSSWDAGASFGQYDGTTPGNNNTDGWIHFELNYTSGDDTIYGTMVRNDNTISFSWSVTSTTLESMDELEFRVMSGSASEAEFGIDNIGISVIPEPSQSALGLVGGLVVLLCLGRRVRR
ncbi:hypothetical protein [Puniceicoccus vermicola]|uniref:PEP-CTERM sorting domain-containing protein n=1 Tax=Puniceicoccus vermicola TaxID=388746 RepID=A0A7X1E5M5_9BACT|nr:hypothetical protein [Puniceicoccus vermicola]MBC2601747.1 hypothetical protein [Puniceicoccus vermicola]